MIFSKTHKLQPSSINFLIRRFILNYMNVLLDFPQIDKVFSEGLEELYHVNPGKHVISDNTSFIQLNPSLSRFPVNPSSTASSVMPVNHSVINNPNNLKSNIYSTSNESPSTIYKLMPSSLASINESKFVGSLSLPDQQANVNPKSCAIFQSNEGLITSNLIINSKCTKPKHPLPLQLPSCSVKSANASFVNPPCSRKNPLQILHSNRRIDFASESFSDNLPIGNFFNINSAIMISISQQIYLIIDIFRGGGYWGSLPPWTIKIFGFHGVFRPQWELIPPRKKKVKPSLMDKFLRMPLNLI